MAHPGHIYWVDTSLYAGRSLRTSCLNQKQNQIKLPKHRVQNNKQMRQGTGAVKCLVENKIKINNQFSLVIYMVN